MGIARAAGSRARKFTSHGLAQHETASGAGLRDNRGIIARAMPGIDRRAHARGHIVCVEHILHADGQAMQRAARAGGLIHAPRRLDGELRIKERKSPHLAFARLGPVETGAHQRLAGQLARCDALRGLDGG